MRLGNTKAVVTGALVLSCCIWLDTGCGGGGGGGQPQGQDGPPQNAPVVAGDQQYGPRAPVTRPSAGPGAPESTRDAVGTGDSDGRGAPTYEGRDLMPAGARRHVDPTYTPSTEDEPGFDDLGRTSGQSDPGTGGTARNTAPDRNTTPARTTPPNDGTDTGGSTPASGGPLLQMPLINQNTGGGTYPGSYCGPTTVRMVLAYYGIQAGADEVALGHFGPGTPMYQRGEGSTHEGMATALKHYGLNANLEYTHSLADLRASIDKGHPVIVNLEGNYGPFYTNGHITVVVGFSENGDPIINDSAGAVQRTIPKRRFMNCWQGLAIETWK
ncbi:MAG: C39 family peptidase [Candidatus Wallbacteria bacterium]|nr:C39 family peptidase [Candidatus Wallbacteria bacterium]